MTEYHYYGAFEDPDYYRTRKVKKDGSAESDTERYWREVKERQVGENTPDYDPWTGSYY